jgi:hypothetical protein
MEGASPSLMGFFMGSPTGTSAFPGGGRANYGLAWAWVGLGFGHERSLDD